MSAVQTATSRVSTNDVSDDTVLSINTSAADGERSAVRSRTPRTPRLSWRSRVRRLQRIGLWIWGDSKYSGIMCMAISSIAYSLMGLFVKLAAVRGVPSSQTVLVRSLVVSALSGRNLHQARHPLLGSPRVRHLVVFRAAIGYVSLATFFHSIQLMPLRDATVLNFTMPVFTALFAAAFLKENWGAGEIAGTVCSFVGVLLVTQPEYIFGGSGSNPAGGAGGTAAFPPASSGLLGPLMAMVASSTGALSYIVVRAIGKKGEPPMVCVFSFAALSALFSAVAVIFQGFRLTGVADTAALLTVGLTAYAAQVFLSRGLQLEKAARATSIQYVKVVCTYLLGVVFLGEIPTLVGSAGALLISASAAFLTYGSGK